MTHRQQPLTQLHPKTVTTFATASSTTYTYSAGERVATTILTTLAKEYTTYVVVDGQTGETVVSGTPSVVEISAVETAVTFTEENAVASITPTTIVIAIGETTAGQAETLTYTVTINGSGEEVIGSTAFVTTFTFEATTLSLSFSSRQTAFSFTGAVSTEITLPSEHTHVTVNGVETAVDLPGLTTTIEASDYTNIIVNLPEVTTEVVIPMETTEFTFSTYDVSGDDKKTCGPYSLDASADAESDHCVPNFTTTIILPTGATESTVFLHATGLTTSFALPGITTTFLIGGQIELNRYICRGFGLSCGTEEYYHFVTLLRLVGLGVQQRGKIKALFM